ncbi:MAG: ribonuclease HII [Chloroflexi bacterium]|nr:ribonuclease HII [Chloroflexota bacterium]
MDDPRPTMAEERRLFTLGYRLVAGVDEVGRGALAGPVVAAAVIMPRSMKSRWAREVRDSKQLAPAERESLYPRIMATALAVGLGSAGHEVIDAIGIVPATHQAMKTAIGWLAPPPQYVLIDYLTLPSFPLPQKGVTDGDSLCFSIACASIVAKVTRDRFMTEMDGLYPGYHLARHKGYCTEEHVACLKRLGPSAIHRRSFQPVKTAGEDEP